MKRLEFFCKLMNKTCQSRLFVYKRVCFQRKCKYNQDCLKIDKKSSFNTVKFNSMVKIHFF